MSLSVIIITKNEEVNLQACLESVRFADQSVVVDSVSTDNTRAIASAFGAEVTPTQVWPGFGPQKNLALRLATQDGVLSLDPVLRLFRRGQADFSNDLVHERVSLKSGTRLQLKSRLLHCSYPTPAHYWRKLAQYSMAWAEQSHARGKSSSMFKAVTSGLMAFLKSYIFRLGILHGRMGFSVCAIQAQAAFGKYFTLYCLNQQNASKKS